MQDQLDALVDVDSWGGAPTPLLYALGGEPQAVCLLIGAVEVAVVLGAGSGAAADVWAAIQQHVTGTELAS